LHNHGKHAPIPTFPRKQGKELMRDERLPRKRGKELMRDERLKVMP
jgi:hypothetical protein